MVVKKNKGRVFGASFTKDEQKAIDLEVRRELLEFHEKYLRELDAVILWVLHVKLGFGHERLKRFYTDFSKEIRSMSQFYDMEGEELTWVMTEKLKKYGIDLVEWENEINAGT